MGLRSPHSSSQYLREAYRNDSRIRWMMHVCTVAIGHTVFTELGSPFNPSHTTKNTSLTPRFFSSVSTAIQNFADSPSPSPAHIPRMSLCPSRSTPVSYTHLTLPTNRE